jgi:hypothetical protein
MILNSPYITGSLTVTGNITASGGITISGSISSASYAANADRVDGLDSTSFVFTSSYVVDSGSMSSRVTTIESKYASTGSNIFQANQTICGNLTTTGTITAQTINVQQVTSSVVYSSGSNIFGNQLINTQQFTGSVFITGSALTVTGGTICTTGNTCFGGMSIISNCLGIGTSTPAYDLTLSKSVAAGNVILNIENTSTTGAARLWFGNNASSTGARIQYFGATHSTRPNLFSIGTDAANDIMFETTGTERARITSTGIACFACQVCAPTYAATGVSRFFAVFDIANTGYRYMEVANCGASMYWGVERSTAAGLIYNSDPYSTVFATTNATNLNFGTNLYKRFSIDCNGISSFTCQVCAPQAYVGGALTSAGDAAAITLKQTSTTATTGMYLERSGERKGYYIYLGGSVDSLTFQRNNAGTKADVMALTRDGNVGIGITTPGAPLHVCWSSSANVCPTMILEGATANNDNYPRLRFKGGTYPDADNKFPDIYVTNGGLGIYMNGGYSAAFNNPTSIGLNNGTITLATGTGGTVNTRFSVNSSGSVVVGSGTAPTVSGGTLMMVGETIHVSGIFGVGSPYTTNLRIDIVYNNWGGNNTAAMVQLYANSRQFANVPGSAFGVLYANNNSGGPTFSSFTTTNITTNAMAVSASSPANYTLRLSISATNNKDYFGYYIILPASYGGTGSSVASITASMV